MTMGARLQEALDRRGLAPPDLIARAKLSKGTIYNILNDTTKPEKVRADTLAKIAGCLGVSGQWITTGQGQFEAPSADDGDSDWADITGYAQAVGLGAGAEAQDYAETHKLKFRESSLRRKRLNPAKLAVMYGEGESMLPRIHPTDAILFDTSDTRPVDGKIFVIVRDRELTVKRCDIIDGTVYFKADNPSSAPGWLKPRRMDDPVAPIKIEGRVRWFGSWED